MFLTAMALIAGMILAYILFVNFHPAFGGDVTKEEQQAYAQSKNFKNEIFVNKQKVDLVAGIGKIIKISRKFFFEKVPNGRPQDDILVHNIDSTNIADYHSPTRLIWFGHSAFLLQMNNKTILIDPMFGDVPAPHPWLGGNRFSSTLPIAIEKLPNIDAVIISHDHYDHLDYGSIKKLKNKVGMFYVPLGVGVHLKAWGISPERIVELDWWQEAKHKDLVFRCTPAQHFSGRKLSNRQNTLWSSWVISSDTENIYFSGDSGYGPHFKEIGEKYGPFDFAMLECGQYNTMWPDVHMFPEETAQAGLDIKAAQIMPIHWGAFKLAMHPWKDPVQRVVEKAKELQIPVITPKIGEPFLIKGNASAISNWWKEVE
jgi:L-ascorbate metabolism protein UlaG (beta-lactamase superfamily)